jgi:hypothetical protein
MRRFDLVAPAVALLALLILSCSESTKVAEDPTPPPLPPAAPADPVRFDVGNGYLWQHAIVGIGLIFFWNTTTTITDDTIIAGRTYAVFSTGELLRSSRDTVYAWTGGGDSIWYRLDVNIGDTVPFIGHRFLVTNVRTQPVFGDSQRTVTVLNSSISHGTTVAYGSYASKFGILLLQRHAGLHDTTTSLLGARIAGREYGVYP